MFTQNFHTKSFATLEALYYFSCHESQGLLIRIGLSPITSPQATSRKVAGLIPGGVIGTFHRNNPSGRTMDLG